MGSRGEKRSYDLRDSHPSAADEPHEKRQRTPGSGNIVQDVVKTDSLQKLAQSLEPMLRRIVAEEVEKAFAKHQPILQGRQPQPALPAPLSSGPVLRLAFANKLSLPLYTGSRVEAEDGSPLAVVLQDALTGEVVRMGPAAQCQLQVVVLEGDFNMDDDEMWTQDVFESNMVRERDGKRPLLTGEQLLCMRGGEGSVGDITFTDNSSWIRSRKFRLGVRVAAGAATIRVREAKTEAFTVKDHRGELYKKHYPPALQDEVWRLDRIGKDGAFHKRLNAAKVTTVEDFLRMVVMDPQKLRNILGSGMSNKMWEGTVEHARTCVLTGKLHVYYADESQGVGVIFNNIFQLMGLIADGQYMSVDALSDNEKVYVDKLVKVAYENWDDVVEYDGEALIGFKPTNAMRTLDAPQPSPQSGFASATPTGPHRQMEQTHSAGAENQASHGPPASAPHDPPTAHSFMSPDTRHPILFADPANSDLSSGPPSSRGPAPSLEDDDAQQLPEAGATLDDMSRAFEMARGLRPYSSDGLPSAGNSGPLHHSHLLDLTLGPDPLSMMSPAARRPPPPQQTKAVEGHGSAEGERAGPGPDLSGLLADDGAQLPATDEGETEDLQMQQLLRMFNDGAQSPGLLTSELTHGAFDLDKMLKEVGLSQVLAENEPAEKMKLNGAHVGWLKLKAALRWGIFVRKRAAERRAQKTSSKDDATTTSD